MSCVAELMPENCGLSYLFRFLSFIGLCLCIALMFISSWYYTIVAWVIAGAIYKYIEYRGASKEWGDATRGLQMSTAMRAILKLGVKPVHAKNWRPQILVYLTLDQNLQVRHDRLLDLVYQLKAGHGLTLVVSILEGDVMERKEDALQAKAYLSEVIQKYRIRGLPEVLVAENIGEGMKNMAQCAGLGNLRHNTLMLSFPEDWRMDRQHGGKKMSQFISTVRAAQACGLAMLVPKGIDTFPKSRSERMAGSVDVWCIVHDGGLLLLTSYLLMRNCAWRKCDLRIFVVASEGDDTVNLKKDMTKFMYDLRINASVEVVAMSTADISAYVAQRTATMEQRKMMLIQMKLSNNEARRDPQHIVDQHRKSISSSDFHDVRSNVNTKKSSIPNTATRSTVIPIVLNDSESAQWDREWNGLSATYSDCDFRLFPCSSKTIRHLHCSSRLNELLRTHSSEADLVIVNMPNPSRSPESDYYYMDYVELLTEGLPRVLLVRGTGCEVITAFSE
ncbi:unnamed protein product [Dicrocoelium dendriticum]|nr:unnamed protein product [Dicrocoelium dendriticum]